jgi:hypothetical protein
MARVLQKAVTLLEPKSSAQIDSYKKEEELQFSISNTLKDENKAVDFFA